MAILKIFIALCLPVFAHAASFEFHSKILLSGETRFGKSLFGGISGLVFDEKTKTLIALSDDRGEHGEPRFYEFAVEIAAGKLDLKFSKVVYLKTSQKRVDFEAIALLPSGNLLIASEGDQNFKPRIAPEILEFTRGGEFVRYWKVPSEWEPNPAGQLKKGVRNNSGIEALAVSPDGALVFASPESNIVQMSKGRIQGQIYKNGTPESACVFDLNQDMGGFSHGVSEAIWKSDQEVWTLERSLQTDFSTRAEIYSMSILPDGSCGKREKILDLAKNSSKVANFEGLAWGPELKSGYRTLIVVTDNNFVLNLPTEFNVYLVK